VDLILPLLTTLYEIFMRPILREILKEREREREGGEGGEWRQKASAES